MFVEHFGKKYFEYFSDVCSILRYRRDSVKIPSSRISSRIHFLVGSLYLSGQKFRESPPSWNSKLGVSRIDLEIETNPSSRSRTWKSGIVWVFFLRWKKKKEREKGFFHSITYRLSGRFYSTREFVAATFANGIRYENQRKRTLSIYRIFYYRLYYGAGP